MAAAASIDRDTVYQAITAAVSLQQDARAQASAALQQWEAESVPGFVGSLISIVQQTEVCIPALHQRRCSRLSMLLSVSLALPQPLLHQRTDMCPPELGERPQMPQNVRLLAAIVAKNTVGSSRRKTMGTKEWFQIPGTGSSSLIFRSPAF